MAYESDILPPPMLTHRGGGFPLNSRNWLSINGLSPCAPRFVCIGYANVASP